MKKLYFILLCLGLFSGLKAQNLPSYLPANGLVGWWPFNGNAQDESGNGNHGTVNGATLTTDRFGNAGKAYDFSNPTDLIEINQTQKNINAYSVIGWFKKSIGSSGGTFFVGSRFPTNDYGLLLGLDNDLLLAFGAENGPNSVWTYSSGSEFVDNNWHLFCAVFNSTEGSIIDSSKLTIFIDNVPLIKEQRVWGNQANVISPVNNNINTIIGNYTYNQNGSFKGILDDIAIYNRALTQQEITQLYQAGNDYSLSYQLSQEKLGNCATSPVKLSVKTLPRIRTDSVMVNANGDAAMAYGNILNDGGKTISRRGFCWSTSANPDLSNSFIQTGSGSGAFSGSLSGLSPSTTYYLRAYAGTATEVWYGNEITISVGNTMHTCGTPGVHNAAKTYGTMIDQDGNSYKTIRVGNQVWMAENLKTAHYRNGDEIPLVVDSIQWEIIDQGAASWYKNDSAKYACPFGKLYNGITTVDPRGLCPVGWHVPSETEWENFYAQNGGDPGFFMSKGGPEICCGYWQPRSNSSGFSALVSGARYSFFPNDSYIDSGKGFIGGGPFLWSSSESDSYLGYLYSPGSGFFSEQGSVHTYPKPCGFSVRCVQDTVATGSITGMQCSEMVLSGNGLTQFLSASELQVSIPYSGGNGASYNEQIIPSTGVTGLCARLIPDRFNQGAGSLILRIGGTPKTAGTAHFLLQLGGISCGFQLEVAPNPLVVNCGAARIERQVTPLFPSSTVKNLSVFCKIPYAGAMDPVFIPSTQVQGLWANLARSGISDELSFIISGKPASSGTAVFQIPIGQGCSFSIPVDTATSAACGFPAVHHPDVAFFDTVSDQDGNVYRTIRIGSQLWMAENLRSGRYKNGDLIPVKSNLNDWGDTTLGATCWYNNDSSANHCPFGRLYNHYAVQDERGLCPAGWRVAGSEDFGTLFSGLNGIQGLGCESIYALPSALKSKAQWEAGFNCASNFSGFSTLPGGFRNGLPEQDYNGQGQHASWWLYGYPGSYYTGLGSDILFGTENAAQGRSVRCIKD
jgi:uncharacterized protein (TIGR02145 family)